MTIPPRTVSAITRNAAHRKKLKSEVSCDTPIDCICNCSNILTRPANLEESCFIFNMTENLYGISSRDLLSLNQLVTEVIYPDIKSYDFHRLNYNHRFNIYPVAIVRAHAVNDVIATIRFCRKYKLPIRARGGSHAYEPASLVNFGIVLDQRPRAAIKVAKRVTIEAGALLGPVINDLSERNISVPFGTCVTNGLAGLTLGGGIGFQTRLKGLTMDVVKKMHAVLADGSVVTASTNTNPDLFFALRGAGGGNFAVVTDFVFDYDIIKSVIVFTIRFPFDDAKVVFSTWQSFAFDTDPALTSEFDIFNRFQPVIVTGQFTADDKSKLLALLQPLLDMPYIDFGIEHVSLKEAAQYFGQGSYARPLFFYNLSDFSFDLLPNAGIDVIIENMSKLSVTQSYHKTEVVALGGNYATVASDATAFPSRDAKYWFQYTSLWDVSTEEPENVSWLDAYYAELRPYFPLNRKYVNALDYNTDRLSALQSYYGSNLPRLIQIKNHFDPTNFFQFEQSIPLIN